MPKNPDIKKVLVLGSGPIIIGQAAEFDYAGTQACRSLKEEGVEVVLLNSNPATIMTDKDIADRVYIEPLTVEVVEQLILKEHINPMVNIGAIEMCSMIHGETYEERFDRLLAFTRKLAGNPEIDVDEAVYLSEKRTGNKNRALAYLLKSSGIIDDDVEEILDIYFRACSIRVTCKYLANIGFVLANHGRGKKTGEVLFSGSHARFVNAILTTCGMYDGSGDFAIKVGLPAKSGVGGGIMAVSPTRMGIGIYSPGLDKKGNSLAGIQMLEQLSETLYLSMF